jgi:hypothetical protein
MPPNLGQLTSLQTLTYFVVGSSYGCSTISELQNINLGGELDLNGLENASEEHAEAANLENKEKLTHLSLKWKSEGHEELIQDCHQNVLDALKPPGGLEMLRIVDYRGSKVPTWVKDLSLFHQHLTELHLVGCTMCEEFPEFSHFRALQVLHLIKLYKLQRLCGNMTSMESPSSKEHQLHDFNMVATRELAFPVLHELDIQSCPRLTNLPEAPKIKVIKIKEDNAQLSLSLFSSRYLSSLSLLELSVSDKDATLELDLNHELSIPEMKITGCSFFFASTPQQKVGFWKSFGQLQALEIHSCSSVIYWPEEEFLSLISLTKLVIGSCSKLTGRAPVNGVAARAREQLLPQLKKLEIRNCERLSELFILPPSITYVDIFNCSSFEFIWGNDDTESMNVQLEHDNALEPRRVPEQLPRNNSLPCLDSLSIINCDKLATLPNLPRSLKKLFVVACPELRSISGHLDAIVNMNIGPCNKLESPDWGSMPVLEHLGLYCCNRLTSLPGSHGNYSALRGVRVEHCRAINMKPLYDHLPQRLDSIEYHRLSLAHSRDPREGILLSPHLLLLFNFKPLLPNNASPLYILVSLKYYLCSRI